MEIFVKAWIIQIDPQDADLVHAHNWYVAKDGHTFYVIRAAQSETTKGRQTTQRLHRVILGRMLGREPLKDEFCDHIDGDGLNNRRSNLRIATNGENQRNRRVNENNTSGYKGATFHKRDNKWRARIEVDGKQIHLGLFATREEAYAVYCEAATRLYGEFARFE